MMQELLRARDKPVIVVGPCAAEDAIQMSLSAKAANEVDADGLRGCLTKPRTAPGFDGIGLRGARYLGDASLSGLVVATEVKNAGQVHGYTKRILETNPNARIMYWIGARTTPLDDVCKKIARAVNRYKDKGVVLGVKNPVHRDLRSWTGAMDHIRSVGMTDERLFLIHRGFHPSYHDNNQNLRNIPDWDLALEAAFKTGLPLFEDPSHQGGPWIGDPREVEYGMDSENAHPVIRVLATHLQDYAFDGYIIEAHPNTFGAKSDAGQQLPLDVLPEVTSLIRQRWAEIRGSADIIDLTDVRKSYRRLNVMEAA